MRQILIGGRGVEEGTYMLQVYHSAHAFHHARHAPHHLARHHGHLDPVRNGVDAGCEAGQVQRLAPLADRRGEIYPSAILSLESIGSRVGGAGGGG